MPDTGNALKEFITQEFLQGRPQTQLDDDTNLLEEEIIDSLGIFLLLGFIQEKFGVAIDPEDVTLDNFETVGTIAELVQQKRTSVT